jgi:predicted TIM-barrel fold metal-dependent hydrolase
MRIDVHTHIFPPAMVSRRDSYFEGEPVFRLLYESDKSRLATVEMLIENMDRTGVDRSVVFGFPWQSIELSRRHNDYVLEAASKYPDRLIPLACVAPMSAGSLEEADRCLRAGARGLGELAVYEHCDAQEALRTYDALIQCCRSHEGVLLIHANEPIGHQYPGKAPFGLDFYYALARMASGMVLILAHWGGGLCFYELLKKEVPEALDQVYYDTAASPYLYRTTIYGIAAGILGHEKILFGSDFPLLSPERYFREFADSGLGEEKIRAILGGNAARLFGPTPGTKTGS